MVSNRILQKILTDLQEITGADLLLFGQNGRILAEAAPSWKGQAAAEREQISGSVSLFREGEEPEGVSDGWHLFRICDSGKTEMVLASACHGAEMAGRIAVSELEALLEVSREKTDRSHFFQQVILDQYQAAALLEEAGRLRIRNDSRRAVFLAGMDEEDCDAALQMLRAVLPGARNSDFVVLADSTHIAVIHEMRQSESFQTLRKMAQMLLDTLNTEAMISVRISYGTPAEQLSEISRSYREAQLAMEVGRIFLPDQMVVDIGHLGIGRLIYELPASLCETFLEETFEKDVLDELDEETMSTIRQFMASSLNISETARQLYVHRNTLVYRLERIEKMTGLDIRKFDEAMTFRIAMMIHDCLKQTGEKQQEEENGRTIL